MVGGESWVQGCAEGFFVEVVVVGVGGFVMVSVGRVVIVSVFAVVGVAVAVEAQVGVHLAHYGVIFGAEVEL